MPSPILSVIIPVYNTEKYIERCIASVEGQSFSDYEIICVDDASCDDSYNILKRLSDKNQKIKLFRNPQNKGAGFTKNLAIQKASGKYLCFVDSDDYLIEGALKLLYEMAIEYNADDVFYLSYSMAESSQKLRTAISAWENFTDRHIYSGIELLNSMLDNHNLTVGAVHHFVKRDLVQKYTSFSERVVNDDMEFSCNLLANLKRVLFLKKELYVYFHRNSGSISNTKKSVRLAHEYIMHGINIYNSLSISGDKTSQRIARKLLKHNVLVAENTVASLTPDLKQDFLQEIFRETAAEGLYIDVSKDTYSKIHGDIYIYGCGNYALDIYRQLMMNEMNVCGFIQTNVDKKELAGKPVFCISDFNVPQNAFLIIGNTHLLICIIYAS